MAKEGDLFYHTWITTAETITGFLMGTIIGTASAVILWWNKTISDICQPYLVVLNSLPKTALAPIIIVWLGNNTKSIITPKESYDSLRVVDAIERSIKEGREVVL